MDWVAVLGQAIVDGKNIVDKSETFGNVRIHRRKLRYNHSN